MNRKQEIERKKFRAFNSKHGTKAGKQICSKIPKYTKRQISPIIINTRNVEAYVKKTDTRTELLVEYDILPGEQTKNDNYTIQGRAAPVNKKSDDFFYQLDNNPTVFSFVSEQQIELNAEEKVVPSVEAGCITTILQKLYLARRSLNPVIDEIINSASKMPPTIKSQCDDKPLCILTRNQFSGAVTAGKLFQEVTEELSNHRSTHIQEAINFSIPETIINMAFCKKKKKRKDLEEFPDQIYIDKELMLQLIELYEVLDKTIRQLRQQKDSTSTMRRCSAPPRWIDEEPQISKMYVTMSLQCKYLECFHYQPSHLEKF